MLPNWAWNVPMVMHPEVFSMMISILNARQDLQPVLENLMINTLACPGGNVPRKRIVVPSHLIHWKFMQIFGTFTNASNL